MMSELDPCHLRKISAEEINALPLWRYNGPVAVVRDEKTLADALGHMRLDRVVGFDTETRPSFVKGISFPPALVQIACHDVVYLIQLTWIPFGEELASFLSDGSVIKTGVAIREDMLELQHKYSFVPAAVVDLGAVAREKGLETHGLRNLAANFLSLRISKATRCSNWEAKNLSRQQKIYAATDAWISRELYLRMEACNLF